MIIGARQREPDQQRPFVAKAVAKMNRAGRVGGVGSRMSVIKSGSNLRRFIGRVARRLRRARGGAYARWMPFEVRQAACADGETLTVSVKYRRANASQRILRVGESAHPPVETVGQIDRFVVSLVDLDAKCQTIDLRLSIGSKRYPLHVGRLGRSRVLDGPATLLASWYKIEADGSGNAELVQVIRPQGVPIAGLESTADGVALSFDSADARSAQSIVARSRFDQREVVWPIDQGVCRIVLVGVPVAGRGVPEYWDFFVIDESVERRVLADTGDIVDYGVAINVPMLVYREATGSQAVYAKPYFRRDGGFAMRTGDWVEREASI